MYILDFRRQRQAKTEKNGRWLKKRHQKFLALKWEKRHSKIWSAKFFSVLQTRRQVSVHEYSSLHYPNLRNLIRARKNSAIKIASTTAILLSSLLIAPGELFVVLCSAYLPKRRALARFGHGETESTNRMQEQRNFSALCVRNSTRAENYLTASKATIPRWPIRSQPYSSPEVMRFIEMRVVIFSDWTSFSLLPAKWYNFLPLGTLAKWRYRLRRCFH